MKFWRRVLPGLPVVALVCGTLPAPAEAQFSQQSKLVGTGIGQGFSVSLSGNGKTAILGGPNDNNSVGPFSVGAAWVFERSGEEWQQQAKLIAPGAFQQGFSVSLSGDGNTTIVGSLGDNNQPGAAWVYTRSREVWQQQAKLEAIGSFDLGYSVSLSGDGNTALVGAPFANGEIGAGFVFVRRHGMWKQQAELVGTDVTGPFSTQGTAVALSGDGNTAVVGGFNDNNEANGGNGAGAAWVFERSHGVWSQQAKLVGTGFVGASMQGYSVSISDDGNAVIVGGPLDNDDVGAAWVFARSSGVWTQQAKLVGTGVEGSFAIQGSSVSLSGDGNTAIVGGPADNNTVGAAWVFKRSGGVWNQQGAKLVANGAIGDALQGFSVSLSGDGDTAILGAPDDNIGAGAAWIFSQKPVFAGMPGRANCRGQSVSALAKQYGGIDAAATALGFDSVHALQGAIEEFCEA